MLDALEAGDRTRAGELLLESHRSLRDDFEVSLPELDAVVRISAEEGSLGGRLMGAGFGGCTIHLVPPEAGQDWERRVSSRYRRLCGIEPCVYPVRLSRSAYAREL
jgi:galactokinase